MEKKKTSSSEELYGELGHAFNFTQGDLEANRAGFWSHRQTARLNARLPNALRLAILAFLLSSILMGFCSFTVLDFNSMSYFRALVMGFIIAVIYCVTYLVVWSPFKADLAEKRVERFVGVAREVSRGDGSAKVFVTENGTQLKLGRRQYQLCQGNIRFIIYATPKAKEILSLEEFSE